MCVLKLKPTAVLLKQQSYCFTSQQHGWSRWQVPRDCALTSLAASWAANHIKIMYPSNKNPDLQNVLARIGSKGKRVCKHSQYICKTTLSFTVFSAIFWNWLAEKVINTIELPSAMGQRPTKSLPCHASCWVLLKRTSEQDALVAS